MSDDSESLKKDTKEAVAVVKPKGRPPIQYDAATAGEICTRLSNGESMRMICLDDRMPSHNIVYKWLAGNPAFQDQYARARQEQADFYADEIATIADTCVDPAKARLQIDARKWFASKVAPKKYGDRIDVEHKGEVEIRVVIGGNQE